MATKQEEQQLTGDGFTSHIVGMSKSQLYDIMCQMKAQIMLGMVKPSQAVPKIQQQAVSQPQVGTQSNAAEMTQVGVQSEASLPQLPIPARPSASSNLQSQAMPPQTSSAFVNSIAPPQSSSSQLHNVMPSSQSSSSQLHNVMPSSQSSSSQLHNVMPSSGPPHYSHIPMVSGQPQHSLQAPPGLLHQPLPQHLRPPSMQPFAHQMPPGLGFQPSQLYFPQSLFHPGVVNPSTSFSQGQAPLQSQQHLQQGFPDRGGHWAAEAGGQFTGGPPPPQAFVWGQMPQATGGNPPPLAPDVEKALLQQVMSLTPEQISLLPPEQ